MQAQKKCENCGRLFAPRQEHFRFCADCNRQRNTGGRGGYSGPTGGFERSASRLVRADGYLKNGYFDEREYVRPEIIDMEGDAQPSDNSRSMVSRAVFALKNGRTQAGLGIGYSQLFKFYQQARATERRLRDGEPFDAVVAELVSLAPKAAVVVARSVAPESFKDFIDTNVALARQSEDAFRKGFLPHYQAVLCYYKYFNPNQK